jgi:spore coat protein A
MTFSRRKFFKVGLMGAAALALWLGTLSIPLTRLGASAPVRSPSVQPFRVPLPIPPVLKPVRTSSDTDYYETVQRVGRQEIVPGLMTEV